MQNCILLIASYIFYGTWDWRFLFLIWISTFVDFFCGQAIASTASQSAKKRFLFISIFTNLSLLGFFKYFNFFIGNFNVLVTQFGFSPHKLTLDIILPVGISFYTFQTMSYTIDIYNGTLKPTKNLLNFSLFVAFFPQLVAGPIERAKNLLPQMEKARKFNLEQFYGGCFLIFWGLFLKIIVADNLATLVDPVFARKGPYDGVVVLAALYAFAFQIFGDFAGYSNIARGLCKCMGFEIMVNFNLPYFVTNPRDFWKRWHISLSTWLRDYLYIPLGGNRRGLRKSKTYRNLFITMLLGGLWHGASWTFVLWGAYHGFLLIVHRFFKATFSKALFAIPTALNRLLFFLKVILFFHFICLGLLIFRAENITQIIQMSASLINDWAGISLYAVFSIFKEFMPFMILLLLTQLFQFFKKDLMAICKLPAYMQGVFYYFCILLFIIFGLSGAKEFYYFQF